MPLTGHTPSLSALTIILLSVQLFGQICETKSSDSQDISADLTYSDSSHGPQTAAAHQQVLYIDHGGGAISHIRRTQFFPNSPLPSVPSLPFRPHLSHIANPIYENHLSDDPYVHFPEDIPRIDRRMQDNHNLGAQPPVPFVPHNLAQPVHQPIQPPSSPVLHHSVQHLPQPIAQPIPQPFPQPISQPISQPLAQPFVHHIPQPISWNNPIPQPLAHPLPQPPPHAVHQQLGQPLPQPVPQPMAPIVGQPVRYPIDDIEDERFLINNEIERIPKPSNQMKPARRDPPVQEAPPPPPPPPEHDQPISPFGFFDGPDNGLFGGFDSPFDIFGPQNGPLFQRRRLTTNNGPDPSQNAIGYPPYNHYKGEESPTVKNWPKIFKFTDGRSNLYEFEKQKKQNKIKFSSKETFFDHISRDAFLILHGGTYTQ